MLDGFTIESNNLKPPAPTAEPIAAECGSKFPIILPVSFSNNEYENKLEIKVIIAIVKKTLFIYPPDILNLKFPIKL